METGAVTFKIANKEQKSGHPIVLGKKLFQVFYKDQFWDHFGLFWDFFGTTLVYFTNYADDTIPYVIGNNPG